MVADIRNGIAMLRQFRKPTLAISKTTYLLVRVSFVYRHSLAVEGLVSLAWRGHCDSSGGQAAPSLYRSHDVYCENPPRKNCEPFLG